MQECKDFFIVLNYKISIHTSYNKLYNQELFKKNLRRFFLKTNNRHRKTHKTMTLS